MENPVFPLKNGFGNFGVGLLELSTFGNISIIRFGLAIRITNRISILNRKEGEEWNTSPFANGVGLFFKLP
jgi:hypothetical protein